MVASEEGCGWRAVSHRHRSERATIGGRDRTPRIPHGCWGGGLPDGGVQEVVTGSCVGCHARSFSATDSVWSIQGEQMSKSVVVRHSGMRDVSGDDLGHVFPAGPVQLFERHVDTRRFNDALEQGDWVGQGAWLGGEAAAVHALFAIERAQTIHYFGIPEIPHAIAFGALVGDEHPVVLHEYDRDRHRWDWPEERRTLELEVSGLPEGPAIRAAGAVVLRIEVSFAIADEDVREAVGENHLAEVRICRRSAGGGPQICAVRSAVDLEAVRLAIREALSRLRAQVPNYELLHLFVAAPISVCFALGQELKPRNAPPIQTYRYRKENGQSSYKPAIELSSRMEQEAESPLSGEQIETARRVRSLWKEVADGVESYIGKLRERSVGEGAAWFAPLCVQRALRGAEPCKALPPIAAIAPRNVRVDDDPVPREFGFTPDDSTWHLSDRLLVGFHIAAGDNDVVLRRLIRMFLFHEYVHVAHSITKARARDVGLFPNCLELLDYTADVYSLLHVLDQERDERFKELESPDAQLQFLRAALGLLIRAFWAFEPAAPVRELQVRRLRRYLNWYWRRAQVMACRDLGQALQLLAAAPHIELAGLSHHVREHRHFCKLTAGTSRWQLELGVVLENLKLLRLPDGPVVNLNELVVAFSNRDSDGIERLFRVVYEEAQEKGGALPP